jgi:hypothetical protein
MMESSGTGIRAEDVDWFAIVQQCKDEASSQSLTENENSKKVKLSDDKTELTSSSADDNEDIPLEKLEIDTIRQALRISSGNKGKTELIAKKTFVLVVEVLKSSGGVPRETVDGCKILLENNHSIAFQFLVKPLVSNGEKTQCELAERLVKDTVAFDELVNVFIGDKTPLFSSDENLLFWQRCMFVKHLNQEALNRVIRDLDCVPSGSTRLPGAIMALAKANGDRLTPHISSLMSILGRCSGVMVAPAKRALQQLIGR